MALSNCNTILYSARQSNQPRKIGRDLAGGNVYLAAYGLHIVPQFQILQRIDADERGLCSRSIKNVGKFVSIRVNQRPKSKNMHLLHGIDGSFAGSLRPEAPLPCSGTPWQIEIARGEDRKDHIHAGLPFDGEFHR